MSFLKSVSSVGALTIVSRVTGYLRDLLIVHFIGVSMVSDALTFAIKLPAFFRRLFAEGAFHVSFLPVFSQLLKRSSSSLSPDDQEDPYVFASHVFSMLFLTLIFFVGIALWKFPFLVRLLFSGLAAKPEMFALVVRLGRITFPFILFISLTSFCGSLLNAFGRFSLFAGSHALCNVFVITYFLCGSYFYSDYGLLFSWSILVSGFLQMVCLWAACFRYRFKIRLVFPHLTPMVRLFLRKLGPGMLGVGVSHINLLVGFYLASRLAQGGVSYLYYADRLNQLPLSIIGVSLSSVLLPLLAHKLHEDRHQALRIQNQAIRFAALLALPVCAILMSMALPICEVLFGHGKLGVQDLHQIAYTIQMCSLGIPAYVCIKIMNTRFFAEGETRIPLWASCSGIIADIIFSLLFIPTLQHLGIALAVVLSAWVQMFFLLYWLNIRSPLIGVLALRRFLFKVCKCSIGMGVFLMILRHFIPSVRNFHFSIQCFFLMGSLSIGIAFFFFLLNATQTFSWRHARIIYRSIRRKEASVIVSDTIIA